LQSKFDQIATSWDQNEERAQLHKKIGEALVAAVPVSRDMRALDFGCGTGAMAFMLAGKLGRIDAIDTSAGMIGELNRKLTGANAPDNIFPLNAELKADSFPAGELDLIYTVLALHHIEDVESLIHIFARLLKPGKHLALIDLDQEDGTFHSDTTGVHHFGFDHKTMTEMLQQNGFSNIKISFPAARRRENPDGTVREYPIFLITAVKKSSS